jgi:hypothetical protein
MWLILRFDCIWSTICPRLTWSSWLCLCLVSLVFTAIDATTLLKIPIIGVTFPVLSLNWSVSQSDLVISFVISLPMISWVKGVAWLVTYLERIAVEIIVASLFTCSMAYPILLSSTNSCSMIIYTFTFLLGVVVDKLPKDTIVSW